MGQMVHFSESEINYFLKNCSIKQFEKKEILSHSNSIPKEIFFINKGIIRLFLIDNKGTEHTIHFAMENEFICDYSAFINKKESVYLVEALEKTEVVVLPRKTIEWCYSNMDEGDKIGRLIAESYFVHQDNYIKDKYSRTPKEMYDSITDVFPNIHNRVPQHMIASYLGITPIHLSRLKKTNFPKL